MEGFLPWYWCVFWYALSLPVIAYGVIKIKKLTDENPELKPLIAVSGAFMFVLSALKLPSVTGSSSHPTGNGLGAVLFGPAVASVLATIVLVFQALLLAHGGITTLGANVFSMGIVGTASAWLVYKGSKKSGLNASIAIFLAAFFGDLLTYVTTSIQLALAFPIPTFESAFLKFIVIFAYTQIPLAIIEGYVTVKILNYLISLRPDIFERLDLIRPRVVESKVINKKHAALYLCIALIIVILPFALSTMTTGGSDEAAVNVILNSGYQQWFQPLWEPSSGMENLLFAAQAAIGLIIIGCFVGYYRKKHKS